MDITATPSTSATALLDAPAHREDEPAGHAADFQLPARADRLTASQRRAILAMVDAMLLAHSPTWTGPAPRG